MNFLFIDIECANCFKGECKMCTFGYVLCDETLNIIEKDDLIINPESPFDWYVKKNIIQYDTDIFKTKPPFPFYYKKIKRLLTADNTYILGHGVINEIKFINFACKRYNLEKINFNIYEMQTIFNEYIPHDTIKSLDKMHSELLNESIKKHHKSDEDAKTTMLSFKNMCQYLNFKPIELLAICSNSLHNSSLKISPKQTRKRGLKKAYASNKSIT